MGNSNMNYQYQSSEPVFGCGKVYVILKSVLKLL